MTNVLLVALVSLGTVLALLAAVFCGVRIPSWERRRRVDEQRRELDALVR